MSFGLKISFGRLCRLEKEREKLQPPKKIWIDEDFYYQEEDGGFMLVNKNCLSFFKETK